MCEECQHNTEGVNCEDCLMGFFQDKNKQSTDEDYCAPCDCEPNGTTNDGLCDGFTDLEEGYIAGKCHCKTYVDGARCDRCMDGEREKEKLNDDDANVTLLQDTGTLRQRTRTGVRSAPATFWVPSTTRAVTSRQVMS